MVKYSWQMYVYFEKNGSDFGSEQEKKKGFFSVIVGRVLSFPESRLASLHHPAAWKVHVCIFLAWKGVRGGTTPVFGDLMGLRCLSLLQGTTDWGGHALVACLLSANLKRWILSEGLTPAQLLCLMGLTPQDIVAI